MKSGTLFSLCALTAIVTGMDQRAIAQDLREAPSVSPRADQEAQDLFAAMRSGALEARLIPKNDREARVLLRNKTKQPLTVRLPDAFAGAPVLAQVARNRRGAAPNLGGNQAIGGGFGGGGLGGGGLGGGGLGGGGGGLFAVPPEKVAALRVEIVCLEHGKRDPRPVVPYEIRPLESVTSKPGVREVLVELASGQVSQRSAQAAAWRLANGLSWDALAGKQIEHLNAPSEPYFSVDEIAGAVELVQVAERRIAANKASSTADAFPSAGR